MRRRLNGVWCRPDFLKLWVGQTVSACGSEISVLALPLTAVLLLGATPGQMGLFRAAAYMPYLLVSLFAGVWADRLRRRPLLIAMNLGQAVSLLTVPVALWLDLLRIEWLYAVALLAGGQAVVANVAELSLLPTLVRREQLVEANGKMEIGNAVPEVVGPSLGGLLVQRVTAPLAVLADVLSFLAAALLLTGISTREPPPSGHARARRIWRDIGEGLSAVLQHQFLRIIAASGAGVAFFANVQLAVYLLFVTRELGIAPALLGLILAVGSGGGLLGALVAASAARRWGVGPTLIAAQALKAAGSVFPVVALGPSSLTAPTLMAGAVLAAAGIPLFSINAVSLRQAVTPDRLQGRVNPACASSSGV